MEAKYFFFKGKKYGRPFRLKVEIYFYDGRSTFSWWKVKILLWVVNSFIHLFIYSFSKIIQKFKIYIYILNIYILYIYTYTLTHRHTHSIQYTRMYMYTVYAYARVHPYIIKYISIEVLGENRTCRRLRVLSSSPENILK